MAAHHCSGSALLTQSPHRLPSPSDACLLSSRASSLFSPFSELPTLRASLSSLRIVPISVAQPPCSSGNNCSATNDLHCTITTHTVGITHPPAGNLMARSTFPACPVAISGGGISGFQFNGRRNVGNSPWTSDRVGECVGTARVGLSMTGPPSFGDSFSSDSGDLQQQQRRQQQQQRQQRQQQQQQADSAVRRGVLNRRRQAQGLLSEQRRKKELERAIREGAAKVDLPGGGLEEVMEVEPPPVAQWPFWRKKRDASAAESRMLTKRIVGLGRRRQLDQVFDLLVEARRGSSKVVNVITMNAAMSACVNCGDIDRALDVFDDMVAEGGTGADSITYGTLLKGLGRAKRLDDAFEVLEAMEDGTAPGRPELTAVHLNTLVNACADAGDARRARTVVQRYKRAFSGAIGPSAFTYNLLIKGYARSDNPMEALLVAEEMLLQGLLLERVTFNCLILACVRAGEMERALDYLQEMKLEAARRNDDSLLPDAVTYTTIIKGLSEDGDLAALRQVVGDMRRAAAGSEGKDEGADESSSSSSSVATWRDSEGNSSSSRGAALVMDRVAYTAIIDAFIAVGATDDALACMRELECLGRLHRGMRPRSHVFLSLLRAMAARGDLKGCQELAGRLVRDAGGRVWPEERAEADELVMEAATRAKEMGVASHLLDEMVALHGHQLRMSIRGMEAIVQLMAATGSDGFERFRPIGIRQQLSLRDTVTAVMLPLADTTVAHPKQTIRQLLSAHDKLHGRSTAAAAATAGAAAAAIAAAASSTNGVIPVINNSGECVGSLHARTLTQIAPDALVADAMNPPPPTLSSLATVSEVALLLSSCHASLVAVVSGNARLRYGLAKDANKGSEQRVIGFVNADAIFEGGSSSLWNGADSTRRQQG